MNTYDTIILGDDDAKNQLYYLYWFEHKLKIDAC